MPSTIHLPIQPSIPDCLAWSADGELAIAAGEEVYLLIPQRIQHQVSESWAQLHFVVTTFTNDEWPFQDQASFEDMSIGEEQARTTIIALSWSPPGLAKHRRSILAVLTSNLILSFWTSASDARDLNSWKRVVIVRDILSVETEASDNTMITKRRQQRVRSMAWAPAFLPPSEEIAFQTRNWGKFLLAITDDDGGLHVLRVLSPFHNGLMDWDITKLSYFKGLSSQISTPFGPPQDRPSLLQISLRGHRFMDNVKFGSWTYDSSLGEIDLSYRFCDSIYLLTLSLSLDRVPTVTLKPVSKNQSQSHIINDYSFDPITRSIPDALQNQVPGLKTSYSTQKALSGHVIAKTWGIACLGNRVAACITLHPSKAAEYAMSAEESTVVIFNTTDGKDLSPQTYCFREIPEIDEEMVHGEILDTILQYISSHLMTLDDLSSKIMYTAILGSMLVKDFYQAQRLQASQELLKMLESHRQINLQAEHDALVVAMPSSSQQEYIDSVRKATNTVAQMASSPIAYQQHLLDTCPICGDAEQAIIKFESLTEAFCPQRHPFCRYFSCPISIWTLDFVLLQCILLINAAARCAITFQPLLQPGSSKRCLDCHREFINELLHPKFNSLYGEQAIDKYAEAENQETTNTVTLDPGAERTEVGQSSKRSLSTFLFQKFDTCPYCEGKFYN